MSASHSSVGSDEQISGSKIQPLESPVKENAPLDTSDRGSVGTNTSIDQTRIDPLGGKGQYQHPAPHADSQGSVGRDDTIQGAKIDPFSSASVPGNPDSEPKATGLDDESVDTARIAPLGEVREELS